MKLFTTILCVLLALTACGKGQSASSSGKTNPALPVLAQGPCSDISNGSWQSVTTPAYIMALDAQCSGATSYCNEVFTYHPQANGTTILLVTSTNGGPECLPMGAVTCTATMLNPANSQMSVVCVGMGGKKVNTNYNRM